MIVLPTKGVAGRPRAIKAHRIEMDVFADWIEASVLFDGNPVSVTDVVEVLLEEELYENQDYARELVQFAWLEIQNRRNRSGGYYGVVIDGDWVKQSADNTNQIAHQFMLTLSLAPRYDWWYQKFGPNYNCQGNLFESLTEMSLRALSPGWSIFSTGWRGSIRSPEFIDIANKVAKHLNTGTVNTQEWSLENAKDLTLDILLYWPFGDTRSGILYVMIQCASGNNWEEKLKDPDIDQWRKLLNPDCLPMRGVSIPFCLPEDRFKWASAKTAGLLLDRCRILFAAKRKADWVDESLLAQISSWLNPRKSYLLERST